MPRRKVQQRRRTRRRTRKGTSKVQSIIFRKPQKGQGRRTSVHQGPLKMDE
jgi:hypothetical protein